MPKLNVLSDQASFLPIIAPISSRAVKGIYLRSSIAACKGFHGGELGLGKAPKLNGKGVALSLTV
ncbi:hypothetical protein PVK06_038154 [Gossypium arboreum]|uniref:Uncharacterized protein n=1 Tax=Gossypium arboreum TaxID=29729 RepID=A0ABR0N1F4_GOSAR|nr:hypothetical protein PVK06_038154 [Gossypium arboreum]